MQKKRITSETIKIGTSVLISKEAEKSEKRLQYISTRASDSLMFALYNIQNNRMQNQSLKSTHKTLLNKVVKNPNVLITSASS